jgi:hypothetical protein
MRVITRWFVIQSLCSLALYAAAPANDVIGKSQNIPAHSLFVGVAGPHLNVAQYNPCPNGRCR